MGSKLFVDKIIEHYLDKNSTFTDDEDKNKLKEKFLDEIKNEVIELEKERYRTELKKEFETKKKEEYFKNAKSLIYEGFIIAFVVGLAVNQVTDLIGITKGSVGKNILPSSLIWSIILICICLFTFLIKFIRSVLSYLENKNEGDVK